MPFSKLANRRQTDWLVSRPIAHRGLHDLSLGVIENSMTAFERAIEAGLPIEFDVHLSLDKVPVIFHDETLMRIAGDPRCLSDVTAEELVGMPLMQGSDFIPTLQSVLDRVAGSVPLVIELKQCPFGRKILAEKIWEILQHYRGKFSIQSFDPLALRWFRMQAPHVIRGQLAMKSPPRRMPAHRKFLMRHMLLNKLSRPDYIGYHCEDIHAWTVKRAVKSDMKLLAWTVSTQEQLAHARRHADNVIFENLPLDQIILQQVTCPKITAFRL